MPEATEQFPGLPGWRRSPCLGCGRTIVAARHSHVLIGGRRDGTGLVIIGLKPDRVMVEEPDADDRGDSFLLGIAHRGCVDEARRRLLTGQVPLAIDLPLLTMDGVDELPEQFHLPPNGRACAFFQSDDQLTDEHVWPQWLSRALRQSPDAPKQLRPFIVRGRPDRRARTIDVTAPICRGCNNRWLATLEQDAQRLLTPMILGESTDLDKDEQGLIATWAAKTALMFDLSSGSEAIIPLGYYRELAQRRTPPSSMCVFIAGYAGPAPAWALREALWVDIPQRERPNAFAITLTAGALVLQVVGHFVVSGSIRDGRWQLARPARQIWPGTSDAISWPPDRTVFDHDALVAFASSFDGRAIGKASPEP